MTSAQPAIDPRALRDAFGCFMTGVTVVTTLDAAGAPQGFTANSFSSVSLDPPLLSGSDPPTTARATQKAWHWNQYEICVELPAGAYRPFSKGAA